MRQIRTETMKKSTIWLIAIIMGLSFVGLLYLQISYIEEMAKMKKEQFDESVNRSLYQASRNLEMNETLRYLEKDVKQTVLTARSSRAISLRWQPTTEPSIRALS